MGLYQNGGTFHLESRCGWEDELKVLWPGMCGSHCLLQRDKVLICGLWWRAMAPNSSGGWLHSCFKIDNLYVLRLSPPGLSEEVTERFVLWLPVGSRGPEYEHQEKMMLLAQKEGGLMSTPSHWQSPLLLLQGSTIQSCLCLKSNRGLLSLPSQAQVYITRALLSVCLTLFIPLEPL